VFSVNCTKQWTHRVCFLWVTAPNSVPSTRVCFLWVIAHFLAQDWMAHHPVCGYIYVSTLLSSHFTTQQETMSSWIEDDDVDSLGPTLWSQQDPEFSSNFLVLNKRDFKSMRDVRKYAPNQTVNWPRCAHSEFCVMQVYRGWDNSGRLFQHCSRAWVSKTPCPPSFIIIWFTNVITVSAVLRTTK
jgi:hypothetical protein